MPQEPASNGNNKAKQRFSGRRRSYVDTFRWGFVSEEESDTGVSLPNTGKTKPAVRPAPTDVPPLDSPPKSKRNHRRKKSASAATPESVPKSQPTPKAETHGKNSVKHSTKTPAGQPPKQGPSKPSTAKQPAPEKRPSKGKKRTKTVLPQYVVNSTYNEDDEDLRLPSYGRTPIPTDDELPVPQKIVRQGKAPRVSLPQKATPSATPVSADIGSDVPVVGFRPRREQMVWDPDRQEYVPLVTTKKPEPSVSAQPPKSAEKPKAEKPRPEQPKPERQSAPAKAPPAKPNKRQERTEKPAEKPVEKSVKKTKEEQSSKQPNPERPVEPPKPPRKSKPEPADTQRDDGLVKRPHRHGEARRGDLPKFVETPLPDPADIESEVSGFAELGVSEAMLESLKIVRYLEPTPIQAGVFQKVQAGTDLMGQAQTGTGKTAAFSIPIIEGVETCPPGNDPVALILVPTRELAVQVRDEAIRLAYGRDIRITACYGGKPLAKQIERLKFGIDILVGTPGRILDLMNRRALSLGSLRWVVLDEADRMLDIGFRPDIEKILKRTPQDRQTLLFSATLPPPVVRLAEKYMKSPEVLDFSNKSIAVDTIDQFYVTVDPERKFDALVYLLEEQQPQQAIIFTRTKRGADRLARLLSKRFDKLAAIHGDLQQSERDRVMAQVRAGSLRYLVATDVVGRGIDVSGISHIINYDIPKFCDDYVHRVGRTGRMGRDGIAFTFVTVQEGSELTRIEMRIDKLLKRAELKGFESFTKPHDPNVSLDDELQPEPTKPVFGKPVRKVRRAL